MIDQNLYFYLGKIGYIILFIWGESFLNVPMENTIFLFLAKSLHMLL